jgi:hypothetical protein
VNTNDFRVTTFATNLSYPLGMVRLTDGSLLVAVNQGPSFFSAPGRIVRLVDADLDGVADAPPAVLYSGLPAGQTSLRRGGNLLFVTGQGSGRPIVVLRAGATPDAPLSYAGQININYPGSWYHPHSALFTRDVPGTTNMFDLFFQLGSQHNYDPTTANGSISSTNITGAIGAIFGDSIYRLTIIDRGTSVSASNLTQIARGLRNPAGFAFHPRTGDFYFQDNGIDGLVDANEPMSADELNMIRAADLGTGPSNILVSQPITLSTGPDEMSADLVCNRWWPFNRCRSPPMATKAKARTTLCLLRRFPAGTEQRNLRKFSRKVWRGWPCQRGKPAGVRGFGDDQLLPFHRGTSG